MGRRSKWIDPRLGWLKVALDLLCVEIEPKDVVLGISIQVASVADKTIRVYSMIPSSHTVTRHIITDPQAAADCVVPGVLDATPDPEITDG
jgi:hypothetical protein